MKLKQYEVHFMGENVWTTDGKPWVFNSFEEALAELEETFFDMENADMDHEPDDYRIVKIEQ